jgi:hypothetical protein
LRGEHFLEVTCGEIVVLTALQVVPLAEQNFDLILSGLSRSGAGRLDHDRAHRASASLADS